MSDAGRDVLVYELDGWGLLAGQKVVLASDCEAAIARAEAAEKDAARYRWLRKNVDWKPRPDDAQGVVYLVATMVSATYGDCDEQTDAAIDAAIAAMREGGRG